MNDHSNLIVLNQVITHRTLSAWTANELRSIGDLKNLGEDPVRWWTAGGSSRCKHKDGTH